MKINKKKFLLPLHPVNYWHSISNIILQINQPKMKISVFDILKSPNASLHDDGLALYNEVKRNIPSQFEDEIKIDFTEIKRCSTLFLNASFGKLLAEFGEDSVRKFIHPDSYAQILNFMDKYNDMWDNFRNKSNYQAYRDEAFA